MKKITVNGEPLTLFMIGKTILIISIILLLISASPFIYIAYTEDGLAVVWALWALLIFGPLSIIGAVLMIVDHIFYRKL